MRKKKIVIWHPSLVTREHREVANGHRSAVVWFNALLGSSKSTIAHAAEQPAECSAAGIIDLLQHRGIMKLHADPRTASLEGVRD